MRKIDHRIVGRPVGKFLEFGDKSVAEAEKVDAIEPVGNPAAALADLCRAMHDRLVAADENPMNGRGDVDIVDMSLPERLAYGLPAEDRARVSCVPPCAGGKTDDVRRHEFQHSLD